MRTLERPFKVGDIIVRKKNHYNSKLSGKRLKVTKLYACGDPYLEEICTGTWNKNYFDLVDNNDNYEIY